MKITANEIKPGMIIEHKDDLWNVLKTQHVKPGKGGAFNQVELKSILKGTKLNERFRSNENIEITPGDRVAQLVVIRVNQVQLEQVEEFNLSDRGDKGFGSTGVS